MEQIRKTFCRYDMVCDTPGSTRIEIVEMPRFFKEKPELETSQAHVHGFYEVVWFRESGGVHYVDFSEYPVKENSMFFISPGQVHSFDSNKERSGFVMKFCSDLLTVMHGNDGAFIKYNVFNTYDNQPFKVINAQDAPNILYIIGEMKKELEEADKLGHKDYLQALIKQFVILIERSSSTQKDSDVLNFNKNSHKTFLAFRRELEHNFRRLHSVKDYAHRLNVSTKTLSSYVAECSPSTPLEIINTRIMLEAKRLLRYSNLMIKEIAFELGFDDPSYFVKFFKRHEHMSPAEYRDPV